MKPTLVTTLSHHTNADDRDLFGQTLRTVVILVGACVLFVGTLSFVAVVVASKAVSSPSASESHDTTPAKKPLSI